MERPIVLERAAVQIPLDELRHNVPVDKDHVRMLARSIEQFGQLAPILLRFNNKDIIDGFHRTEALRLIGARTAETNLIDCTTDEFRDARITSAVLHKGVTFPRVVMWTREVFDYTPWASKMRGAEAFHLDQAAQHPKPYRRALRRGLTAEEIQEITSWVRDKSATWGLSPEKIARMLNLADLTAPSLIPLVGSKSDEGNIALTTTMLRSLVKVVPDHQAQEAIVNKTMAEKLNKGEVSRLINSFARSQTPEEQQKVLSTSWLTIPSPESKPQIIIASHEEQRRRNEESRIKNERFRIEMIRSEILQIAESLPMLPINNHPDMKPLLNDAINRLLSSVAYYQGKDVEIITSLQEQIDQLLAENKSLLQDNQLLSRRITSLEDTRAVARRIGEDESRLRSEQR